MGTSSKNDWYYDFFFLFQTIRQVGAFDLWRSGEAECLQLDWWRRRWWNWWNLLLDLLDLWDVKLDYLKDLW